MGTRYVVCRTGIADISRKNALLRPVASCMMRISLIVCCLIDLQSFSPQALQSVVCRCCYYSTTHVADASSVIYRRWRRLDRLAGLFLVLCVPPDVTFVRVSPIFSTSPQLREGTASVTRYCLYSDVLGLTIRIATDCRTLSPPTYSSGRGLYLYQIGNSTEGQWATSHVYTRRPGG